MTTKNSLLIIKMLADLKRTKAGFLHYDKSKKLQIFCLCNPEAVAEIAFDNDIPINDREKILFVYSSDHIGSCIVYDNFRWAKMMRAFVIPHLEQLPDSFQHEISWYQRIHGL